mgnify:FL=1
MQPIDELTPKAVNREIAERMGWRTEPHDKGFWLMVPRIWPLTLITSAMIADTFRLEERCWTQAPDFYHGPAAALWLVEEMRKRGWTTFLDNANLPGWEVEIDHEIRGESHTFRGPFPAAISRACLAALREEKK